VAIEQILGTLGQLGQRETTRQLGKGGDFAQSLRNLVDAAAESNHAANDAVAKMLDGSGDVHDAMIALQRADLTLQLTVQVKNKLVQAYQEIMRTPV
jgi:flagellar hook-basal body complex protein FliE